MFDKIKVKTLRTHKENGRYGHGYACKFAREGMRSGWSWNTKRVGFK